MSDRNIKPTQGRCQHLRNPDGGLWCGYTGPTRWWSSPEPLPICVACHYAAMRWTADARDAAEAALERVRELHVREDEWCTYHESTLCGCFGAYCEACKVVWPCPTIQALDGSADPEPVDLCRCDGAAYEVQRHPFLVHPECPLHGPLRFANEDDK